MSRKQREKRARAKSDAQSPIEKGSEHDETKPVPPRKDASINRLGLIVAVVAFVGLFAVVLYLGDGPPPPDPATADSTDAPDESDTDPKEPPAEKWQAAFEHKVPIEPGRDYVRGPEDAPVTIVEFTDFECPFCKIAHESLKEVLKRYPDDVRLVYKNFPLDMACNGDMAQQLHPYACLAAVMARCLGETDPELFWRFHDEIFEGDGFDDAWLYAKAAELGGSDESFQSCVTGREKFDEVRADIELARALGVNATPTVYVNGREAPSYETVPLSEVIDHILESN